MQVTTATADALSKYMDLTAEQVKLTAANMANIDTPGYKTQGFDFGQEFSSAMAGAGRRGPVIGEVGDLVARPDGNTVSIDRETMQLAKSQIQFRTAVELLKHEYSRIMSAIHADSK